MVIRYVMYFMATGLIILAIVFGFVMFTLSNIVGKIAQISNLGEDIQLPVQNAILSAWVVCAVVFVAFAVLSVAMGILITQKVIGPTVPIRRHIAELKRGYYKIKSRLREHDEFQEIMDDLNDLARTLESRHGSVAESAADSAPKRDASNQSA